MAASIQTMSPSDSPVPSGPSGPATPAVKSGCEVVEVPTSTTEGYNTNLSYSSYFVKTVVNDDGNGFIGVEGSSGFISYTDKALVLPGAVEASETVERYDARNAGTAGNLEPEYSEVTRAQSFVADSLVVRYAVAGSVQPTQTDTVALPGLFFRLFPYLNHAIIPGTVRLSFNGQAVSDRSGQGALYWDDGTLVGAINYQTKLIFLENWTVGDGTGLVIEKLITVPGEWSTVNCMFRVSGAPLQPGSLILQATKTNGELINITANNNGELIGDDIEGLVDQVTGIVKVNFGNWVVDADLSSEEKAESWYSVSNVQEDGTIWKPVEVFPSSIKYSCVVYTFLPLDADLIGLDPVRLPSDGRVPIFRTGDVAVISDEGTHEITPLPSAGATVSLPKTFLADVVIRDAEDNLVTSDMYEFDRKLGEITFASPIDWAGYTAPLTATYREEDMALITDVQINGTLKTAAPISKSFDSASAKVSSALIFGDMVTRYYNLFHQHSWTGEWSSSRIGDDTSAKYDEVSYPILVRNDAAIKQRWAIIFTGSTSFRCIGETRGEIGTGSIDSDFQPLNSLTGKPYFHISAGGWGGGWVSGNVLRFDTEASEPFWISRCILQGEATHEEDVFCIQARGDSE